MIVNLSVSNIIYPGTCTCSTPAHACTCLQSSHVCRSLGADREHEEGGHANGVKHGVRGRVGTASGVRAIITFTT